jgi:membrane protein
LTGFLNIYVINNLEYYGLIENSQAISGLIVIKNLLIIIMVYFATSILYYYGAKEKKYIKLFSVGAVMTTSLFIVNSYLFGLYVIKFSSYNELYGSIGALLVLLLFIWLNANILLLGFELNTSINFFKNKNK